MSTPPHGFRSESHMIIEAVRSYISKKTFNLTPEELADLIAKRLSGTILISLSEKKIDMNIYLLRIIRLTLYFCS